MWLEGGDGVMSELKLYKVIVWIRDLDLFVEEVVWEVFVIVWDYKGVERLVLEYFE